MIAEASLAARGLTEREAAQRRADGQGNTAPPPTGRTYWQIISENVFTFINVVLFGLGLALALVGRPGDALVSSGVISLNILVSVVQEIRAKRTLDRIALLTRPTATVLRDGQARSAPPEDLVVGDVLKAGPGDQIVLDGRVVEGRMQVDESQLTGESSLIAKKEGDPVYSGSFCVSGGALFVVEKVGAQSFANQITAGARAFRRVLTPLQNEVYLVIRIMLLIVIYLEFLLFANSLINQINLAESVQNSTMIASLVPNGLFLSITVAYALGAVRIIRFGALVQQANAIESLSNVDVVCLDKTGTLTANRLKVHAVHPLGIAEAALKQTLGDLVASASSGNKTSEAIAAVFPGKTRALAAEVPFSSARKWSAVAFKDEGGRMRDEAGGSAAPLYPSSLIPHPLHGVYALGAPEMLQPYLGAHGDPHSPIWESIRTESRRLTDQGLRVLLVTHHADPSRLEDQGDDSRLPGDMTPIGLISLSDELRPEARETLESFIRSGVRPKIISGDNPETVAALARQAGLGSDVRLVSGLELERMNEAQFQAAATSATIFGRITPQQKEKLVEALRRHGHYVAMIGDGVNDVLSLKKAHLGIAMQSGSQATRGVADIVLMQDSFAALAPAVQEGQRIVNGMQDILKLFLTRILTMGLLILSSLVIGEFPLALRHGSLITLFSVGIPATLLAVWARPGVTLKGTLIQRLARFVLTPVLITSAIALLVFYGALFLLLAQSGQLDPGVPPEPFAQAYAAARPVAQTTLTAFLVVCGLLLVVFVEPPSEWWTGADVLSGDKKPMRLAVWLMAAFVVIMAAPELRQVFSLSPLGTIEIGLVAAAGVVWLFLVRFLWRRRVLERFLGVKFV